MSNELDPVIDQWYRPEDKGDLLRVVAFDADASLVEVQYFDGSIEEVDLDTWRELDIDLAEEPEDWSGPFDDLEADDMGDTDVTTTGLNRIDTKAGMSEEAWQHTRPSDERDVDDDEGPIEPYASEEKPESEV